MNNKEDWLSDEKNLDFLSFISSELNGFVRNYFKETSGKKLFTFNFLAAEDYYIL